ncbi:MAG: CPBP family intramembrane metalloprotease, partial [Frankiales bacterium]|nr:CPBP family intramembrane metalloprotease [Frankiales bacterium]
MTVATRTAKTPHASWWSVDRWTWVQAVALLAAFAAAVALRVTIGGVGVAQSAPAGWVFAGCLVALALATGTSSPVGWGSLTAGLGVGALLCVPVGIGQLLTHRPLHDAAGFWSWALVVTVVATAEELFLRGALYDVIHKVAGTATAVVVGPGALALLHVPLYGWHVLPLDLAVGVVLGGLRAQTGT